MFSKLFKNLYDDSEDQNELLQNNKIDETGKKASPSPPLDVSGTEKDDLFYLALAKSVPLPASNDLSVEAKNTSKVSDEEDKELELSKTIIRPKPKRNVKSKPTLLLDPSPSSLAKNEKEISAKQLYSTSTSNATSFVPVSPQQPQNKVHTSNPVALSVPAAPSIIDSDLRPQKENAENKPPKLNLPPSSPVVAIGKFLQMNPNPKFQSSTSPSQNASRSVVSIDGDMLEEQKPTLPMKPETSTVTSTNPTLAPPPIKAHSNSLIESISGWGQSEMNKDLKKSSPDSFKVLNQNSVTQGPEKNTAPVSKMTEQTLDQRRGSTNSVPFTDSQRNFEPKTQLKQGEHNEKVVRDISLLAKDSSTIATPFNMSKAESSSRVSPFIESNTTAVSSLENKKPLPKLLSSKVAAANLFVSSLNSEKESSLTPITPHSATDSYLDSTFSATSSSLLYSKEGKLDTQEIVKNSPTSNDSFNLSPHTSNSHTNANKILSSTSPSLSEARLEPSTPLKDVNIVNSKEKKRIDDAPQASPLTPISAPKMVPSPILSPGANTTLPKTITSQSHTQFTGKSHQNLSKLNTDVERIEDMTNDTTIKTIKPMSNETDSTSNSSKGFFKSMQDMLWGESTASENILPPDGAKNQHSISVSSNLTDISGTKGNTAASHVDSVLTPEESGTVKNPLKVNSLELPTLLKRKNSAIEANSMADYTVSPSLGSDAPSFAKKRKEISVASLKEKGSSSQASVPIPVLKAYPKILEMEEKTNPISMGSSEVVLAISAIPKASSKLPTNPKEAISLKSEPSTTLFSTEKPIHSTQDVSPINKMPTPTMDPSYKAKSNIPQDTSKEGLIDSIKGFIWGSGSKSEVPENGSLFPSFSDASSSNKFVRSGSESLAIADDSKKSVSPNHSVNLNPDTSTYTKSSHQSTRNSDSLNQASTSPSASKRILPSSNVLATSNLASSSVQKTHSSIFDSPVPLSKKPNSTSVQPSNFLLSTPLLPSATSNQVEPNLSSKKSSIAPLYNSIPGGLPLSSSELDSASDSGSEFFESPASDSIGSPVSSLDHPQVSNTLNPKSSSSNRDGWFVFLRGDYLSNKNDLVSEIVDKVTISPFATTINSDNHPRSTPQPSFYSREAAPLSNSSDKQKLSPITAPSIPTPAHHNPNINKGFVRTEENGKAAMSPLKSNLSSSSLTTEKETTISSTFFGKKRSPFQISSPAAWENIPKAVPDNSKTMGKNPTESKYTKGNEHVGVFSSSDSQPSRHLQVSSEAYLPSFDAKGGNDFQNISLRETSLPGGWGSSIFDLNSEDDLSSAPMSPPINTYAPYNLIQVSEDDSQSIHEKAPLNASGLDKEKVLISDNLSSKVNSTTLASKDPNLNSREQNQLQHNTSKITLFLGGLFGFKSSENEIKKTNIISGSSSPSLTSSSMSSSSNQRATSPPSNFLPEKAAAEPSKPQIKHNVQADSLHNTKVNSPIRHHPDTILSPLPGGLSYPSADYTQYSPEFYPSSSNSLSLTTFSKTPSSSLEPIKVANPSYIKSADQSEDESWASDSDSDASSEKSASRSFVSSTHPSVFGRLFFGNYSGTKPSEAEIDEILSRGANTTELIDLTSSKDSESVNGSLTSPLQSPNPHRPILSQNRGQTAYDVNPKHNASVSNHNQIPELMSPKFSQMNSKNEETIYQPTKTSLNSKSNLPPLAFSDSQNRVINKTVPCDKEKTLADSEKNSKPLSNADSSLIGRITSWLSQSSAAIDSEDGEEEDSMHVVLSEVETDPSFSPRSDTASEYESLLLPPFGDSKAAHQSQFTQPNSAHASQHNQQTSSHILSDLNPNAKSKSASTLIQSKMPSPNSNKENFFLSSKNQLDPDLTQLQSKSINTAAAPRIMTPSSSTMLRNVENKYPSTSLPLSYDRSLDEYSFPLSNLYEETLQFITGSASESHVVLGFNKVKHNSLLEDAQNLQLERGTFIPNLQKDRNTSLTMTNFHGFDEFAYIPKQASLPSKPIQKPSEHLDDQKIPSHTSNVRKSMMKSIHVLGDSEFLEQSQHQLEAPLISDKFYSVSDFSGIILNPDKVAPNSNSNLQKCTSSKELNLNVSKSPSNESPLGKQNLHDKKPNDSLIVPPRSDSINNTTSSLTYKHEKGTAIDANFSPKGSQSLSPIGVDKNDFSLLDLSFSNVSWTDLFSIYDNVTTSPRKEKNKVVIDNESRSERPPLSKRALTSEVSHSNLINNRLDSETRDSGNQKLITADMPKSQLLALGFGGEKNDFYREQNKSMNSPVLDQRPYLNGKRQSVSSLSLYSKDTTLPSSPTTEQHIQTYSKTVLQPSVTQNAPYNRISPSVQYWPAQETSSSLASVPKQVDKVHDTSSSERPVGLMHQFRRYFSFSSSFGPDSSSTSEKLESVFNSNADTSWQKKKDVIESKDEKVLFNKRYKVISSAETADCLMSSKLHSSIPTPTPPESILENSTVKPSFKRYSTFASNEFIRSDPIHALSSKNHASDPTPNSPSEEGTSVESKQIILARTKSIPSEVPEPMMTSNMQAIENLAGPSNVSFIQPVRQGQELNMPSKNLAPTSNSHLKHQINPIDSEHLHANVKPSENVSQDFSSPNLKGVSLPLQERRRSSVKKGAFYPGSNPPFEPLVLYSPEIASKLLSPSQTLKPMNEPQIAAPEFMSNLTVPLPTSRFNGAQLKASNLTNFDHPITPSSEDFSDDEARLSNLDPYNLAHHITEGSVMRSIPHFGKSSEPFGPSCGCNELLQAATSFRQKLDSMIVAGEYLASVLESINNMHNHPRKYSSPEVQGNLLLLVDSLRLLGYANELFSKLIHTELEESVQSFDSEDDVPLFNAAANDVSNRSLLISGNEINPIPIEHEAFYLKLLRSSEKFTAGALACYYNLGTSFRMLAELKGDTTTVSTEASHLFRQLPRLKQTSPFSVLSTSHLYGVGKVSRSLFGRKTQLFNRTATANLPESK